MTTTETRVPAHPAPLSRNPHRWLLVGLLIGAFAIRVIGIRHGLPFAYNIDEELHFVPPAAAAADGHLDPEYYQNPTALTYLLALCFRLVFFGQDVTDLLASNPTLVFTVARVVVALLGTLLVWVVYRAATRFFDRTVGLVAGAFIAFAFLPVFYSHQALNDVPTLLGVSVALVGCRAIYDRGDLRSFVITAIGLGAATGTKYLAAPLAITVILVVALRVRQGKQGVRQALRLLCIAGAVTVGVIIILNPFLVIEVDDAWSQYQGQADAASTPKLGQHGSGWTYYPWTLLWGFGVVPLAMAVVGLVALVRTDRVQAAILTSFPIMLYLHMASQGRFFGRWILPMYPALALLAGYGVVVLGRWLRNRSEGTAKSRLGSLVLPSLAALCLAQPVVDSVRSDLLLLRQDTRAEAHAWMTDNLPEGARLAPEPSLPRVYWDDLTNVVRYPQDFPFLDFEETLTPGQIDTYRAGRYCWVLVNSHQRDRGLAEGLPGAEAYYQRLEKESRAVATFSPYRSGSTPPEFSFDFSFDYYPWAYHRPGSYLEIRRLRNC